MLPEDRSLIVLSHDEVTPELARRLTHSIAPADAERWAADAAMPASGQWALCWVWGDRQGALASVSTGVFGTARGEILCCPMEVEQPAAALLLAEGFHLQLFGRFVPAGATGGDWPRVQIGEADEAPGLGDQVIQVWLAKAWPPGGPLHAVLSWRPGMEPSLGIFGYEKRHSAAHQAAAERARRLFGLVKHGGGPKPGSTLSYPELADYIEAIRAAWRLARKQRWTWDSLPDETLAGLLCIHPATMHQTNKRFGLTMRDVRQIPVSASYPESKRP